MRSTFALGRPPDAAKPSLLLASEEFERLSLPNSEYVYWAKRVEAGKRIAVATSPRGQHGKFYSLHLLDASVSQAAFRQAAEARLLGNRFGHFFSDAVSPLLLSLPTGPVTWLLTIRPQAHHLQVWDVYASPVSRHVCEITARYEKSVPPAGIIVD